MEEMKKEIPNPGSPAAIRRGCLCPEFDNGYGTGGYGAGPGRFWITENCPLHDPKGTEHERE